MRILIVQNTDWIKRNPTEQHHLAEMLSLRGHEIRVIDFEILWRTQSEGGLYSRRKELGNVAKIYDDAKVSIIRPPFVKIPLLDYVSFAFSHRREVTRQVREFAPDVIVNLGLFSYAGKVAKRNNLPFICYWMDVTHRLIPFKPLQFIGRVIERGTLRVADMVIIISDKLRDYVIGMGAPPERTKVLKVGVNLELFSPISNGHNSHNIRKQYDLKEQDVSLLFVGRLFPFSGLKEVALQLAEVEHHNLKLLIVGDGEVYAELQKLRERPDLQSKVILAGRKPYHELPFFIAASDICVLPFHNTGVTRDIIPTKMYEYMAMGKPVISTRLPGIVKEFGEDIGVIYVDRPEEVVGKAMELARGGRLEELGAKARTFAGRHSWDVITDEFEEILKKVVEEKRNRRKHDSHV